MSVQQIPVWKQAPFMRLFPPLCAGLIAGKYLTIPAAVPWIIFVFSILLLLAFLFLNTSFKHRYSWITGLLITMMLGCTGMLLIHHHNMRNIPGWIGAMTKDTLPVIVQLEEPLQEKNKSYKAIASVLYYRHESRLEATHGKLLIYFNKDTACAALKAGYKILINKKPEWIRNHGNPGAFNYAAYAAMQGIHHQLYLRAGEFIVVKKERPGFIKRIIHNSRSYLLSILRNYIPGKIESGLAEALLIGYKDDLDKMLLSAYSNTGVVHVIAISGLHLGLIYWLLAGIFSMIGRNHKPGFVKPFTIIGGLWVFSVLAGASPSVLRSALMFTFIVAGERSGRKTSIFNSLAASAFLLLCFNPFWLWDTGFQLSYIAVLSLVIFMKPVYDSIYIRNKLLDSIWKLTAVTIAAQILTFPVCIYLFHQFPVYFLIANLFAIPLSSLVLLAEILLCLVSFLHPVALICGKCIQQLIILMNNFIVLVEKLPFSSLTRIQVSLEELVILYLLISALYFVKLYKSKRAFYASLFLTLVLASVHSLYAHNANGQRKVIVYDIRGKAVELINGRESFLFTSSTVKSDKLSTQYCFEPSLIFNRINKRKFIFCDRNTGPISMGGVKLMIIHKQPSFPQTIKADLLLITGNPRLDSDNFFRSIDCKLVLFDRTNSTRQVKAWKQYCFDAGINYWDVTEKGAFIINLNSRSFATR
jgi:competence protein ComEC